MGAVASAVPPAIAQNGLSEEYCPSIPASSL